MISNPCKWFANGGSFSNQRSFEYEGGNILYHFSPDRELDKVFDHWIPINLIFFANSKEHAIEVIERMLNFRIECNTQYQKLYGRDYIRGELTLSLPSLLLSKKDKWVITEAPTNQFYNVSWADNDTIL